MEDNKRDEQHRKIAELETIFPEMERILGTAEKALLSRYSSPKLPVIFIVGCARSGSTLVYQYLSETGKFVYPSNLISRFYYAPFIGARIQQLLTDYDLRGEVFNRQPERKFESNLGKTFGPRQPHEFWYFWNRFFKFKDVQKLDDESLANVEWATFLQELHAFQEAYGLPLLMKAMNMNYHITDLAARCDRIHFLFVKRDVLFNAQSLLLARKKFFGNFDDWYSFKPVEYETIKAKPFWEQAVDQVVLCHAAVEQQLRQLKSDRYSVVEYEKFCREPQETLKGLNRVLSLDGVDEMKSSIFENENAIKIDPDIWERMTRYAAQYLESENREKPSYEK